MVHVHQLHTHHRAGVYLSLKGVVYANNSVIPITEIGETDDTSNNGLQCITDKRPCCQTQLDRFGEWYYPDGMTAVPGPRQSPTTFSRVLQHSAEPEEMMEQST